MLYPSNNLDQKEKEMTQTDLNQNNILDWDDEQYYGDISKVSNSHLKVLLNGGPEALEDYHKYGSEDKPAYAFGRALHCLILEPEEFNKRYYVFDDRDKCIEIGGARPTATKAYKEWREDIAIENRGKEMISIDDIQQLKRMEDKLKSIPQVVTILENTKREVVYQATINGVECKGKLDAVKPNEMIIDLKSCANAPTLANFAYDFKKYKYARQMAFYSDIAQVPTACIIAIQKTAPFTVGVFYVSEESMIIGREEYTYALNMYKEQYRGNLDIDKFYYQGLI
tara:strand:+ start:400 stop:1248 length:849 start_codon:yes stop_codon:yes gene_type:complete